MKSFALNIDATQELGHRGELGGETVEEGGFFAETHDQPIGIAITRLFGRMGIDTTHLMGDPQSNVNQLYRRSNLWLIPHGASIVRRSGFAEPTAVGLEVRYKNEGRTCSVRSLIPSFRFIELGHVRAQVDIAGEIKIPEAVPQNGTVKDILGLKCAVSSQGSIGLHLEAAVTTPYISAVGENSSRCEWRFDKYREPLFGRDIQTWAIVALPKRQKEIKYDIRFYFTARTLMITRRYESTWIERTCQLDQ